MTAPNETASAIEETEAQAEAAAKAEAERAGADQLGDAGKKALDRMKAEREAAKKELAGYKALGLDPEKLQELIGQNEASKQAAEQERSRREMQSEALSKANERLVNAEIRAAAAGKLANPSLAVKLLDAKAFDVNDDGEVDSAAITAAIDELVKNEPYLAATQGGSRFQGTGDGGPKQTAAGTPQLTQSDLDRMSAARDHAGIEKARAEGRFNKLLGIEQT